MLFSKKKAFEVLRRTFGYDTFRLGQLEAVKALAVGKDVLVVMPTGHGKSIIYQVPGLAAKGTMLIVSPLISLMKDQVDMLKSKGVAAEFLNSSLSEKEANDVLDSFGAGRIKLLYITPERFKVQSFIDKLTRCHISFFAVDECHCISSWGHDFRIDYRRLGGIREILGVPTIGLTATATKRVQDDVVEQLKMKLPVRIITGFDRPNLQYEIEHYDSSAEKELRFKSIMRGLFESAKKKDGKLDPAIFYCGTQKQTDHVAQLVGEIGRSVDRKIFDAECVVAYHAGLKDGLRKERQDKFMSGDVPLVAATNAFGMGIDKSNVRHVIHFSLPGSVEAWYQEVGRAGRDGQPSRCITIYSQQDVALRWFFINMSNPPAQVFRNLWDLLWSYKNRILDMTYEKVAEAYAEVFGKRDASSGQVETALRLMKKGRAIDPNSPRGHLILMESEQRPIDAFINFKLLIEKRSHDVEYLKQMIRFTESTSPPIRERVLQYFGEKPVQKGSNDLSFTHPIQA